MKVAGVELAEVESPCTLALAVVVAGFAWIAVAALIADFVEVLGWKLVTGTT
eukprot:m.25781 g.25781  ORF g.25781 m.25781 type:complete len:52 (-) comp5800_c2_seq1:239-394(-)